MSLDNKLKNRLETKLSLSILAIIFFACALIVSIIALTHGFFDGGVILLVVLFSLFGWGTSWLSDRI